MRINTGHIISACLVKDEQGYSHPKHRDTRPNKDRKAPRGFKLADLTTIRATLKPTTREGKELLRWILKWA